MLVTFAGAGVAAPVAAAVCTAACDAPGVPVELALAHPTTARVSAIAAMVMPFRVCISSPLGYGQAIFLRTVRSEPREPRGDGGVPRLGWGTSFGDGFSRRYGARPVTACPRSPACANLGRWCSGSTPYTASR